MKIICLFAQRKCRYEGEYAPELIAAMDEYGYHDNSYYIHDQVDTLKHDDDIEFFKLLAINIPDEDFDEVFFPTNKDLNGTIEEAK